MNVSARLNILSEEAAKHRKVGCDPDYVSRKVKNGSWPAEDRHEVAISTESPASAFTPVRQWEAEGNSGRLAGPKGGGSSHGPRARRESYVQRVLSYLPALGSFQASSPSVLAQTDPPTQLHQLGDHCRTQSSLVNETGPEDENLPRGLNRVNAA
ncbi:SMC5-SMC6 complex localization factor protein 1 isoform X1, partial [Lates japonicus]